MQSSHLLSICIEVSPTYALKFCKVACSFNCLYHVVTSAENEIEKQAPHALEN